MSRLIRRYPLTLLLLLPGPLAAQAAADSGRFVVRHGRDTVAIETFARSKTKLDGTLTIRGAKLTTERYSAVIAPDATLPLIELLVREGVDSGSVKAKILQRARVIFKEDSVAVDELSGAGLTTRIFDTEVGAIPYLNLSFALLEQAVRRARAVKADSQMVSFFNLGGGQTLTAKLEPVGRDSVHLNIGDVRFHLRIDRQGRVLGGRIPSQDVVAERK